MASSKFENEYVLSVVPEKKKRKKEIPSLRDLLKIEKRKIKMFIA